jgi:hypothetical protein
MPSIPAFCDNCGTVFNSGLFCENAINVTLSQNRSGPCPNCGGWGHVPSGLFNFIGGTIQILSAPERTIAEFTFLTQIIRNAKAKKQSSEEVAAQIRKDLPGLTELANLLPKNRGELYGFLAVVLAVITLLTQSCQSTPNISIGVSQVVEQTILNASAAKQKLPIPPQLKKKVGRNGPCPCGSGKKFKKCCGLKTNGDSGAASR